MASRRKVWRNEVVLMDGLLGSAMSQDVLRAVKGAAGRECKEIVESSQAMSVGQMRRC